jgi:molecular chaperone GrpE
MSQMVDEVGDDDIMDEGIAEAVAATPGSGERAEGQPSANNEIAAIKDQLLRMAADFDNYRKRSLKEKQEIRQLGIASLVQDLLPVIDNLERALQHVENREEPLARGVAMVRKQLEDVLGQYGVTTYASRGMAFNPELHEAIGQEPSDECNAGCVVREVERGYRLHERLLRPARVIVSAGSTDGAGGDSN